MRYRSFVVRCYNLDTKESLLRCGEVIDVSSSILQAVVAHYELPLLRIAQIVGSHKKPKWEEPLCLTGEYLCRLLPTSTPNQRAYLFHFGSIVFVDFAIADIVQFLHSLQGHGLSASLDLAEQFRDDYRIEWNAANQTITNDAIFLTAEPTFQEEIIATVLAKSVAFEATEKQVDELLDEMESTIAHLKQGKLSTSDTALSSLFGRILGYKLNSVSSLMLLDKPEITWEDEQASMLFTRLNQLFEITARYDIIRHKSDTLMSIAEVFSSLVHARRSTLLEWGIIILILIEIILSLWQMQ